VLTKKYFAFRLLFLNLPDPDVLALEIVENLEAGLDSFKAIIASLNAKN